MYTNSYFAFVYRIFAIVIGALFLMSIIFSPADAVVRINRIHTPFLDLFFVFMTNLGNGLILIPFVILLCFRNIYLSVALVISEIIDGIIVLLCKRILFPVAIRPMQVLDHSLVHFVPGVEVHKVMSFPSGHTVTIFGLCIFLALSYKNKFIALILSLLAFPVAISRVYLLQHFVSDVAGGALIGSVVGILVYHWVEHMNKPKWMNQRFEIKFRVTGHGLNSVR